MKNFVIQLTCKLGHSTQTTYVKDLTGSKPTLCDDKGSARGWRHKKDANTEAAMIALSGLTIANQPVSVKVVPA